MSAGLLATAPSIYPDIPTAPNLTLTTIARILLQIGYAP